MGYVGTTHTETRSAAEVEEMRSRVVAALEDVVGERWVETDPLVLDTYARQYIAELTTGSNYMERPLAVVLPESTEEVAAVVRVCNREGCQFKAISTGFGAWGAPTRPDWVVQVDLRRLDRICHLDRENMYAVVEPYVTGNQLQVEAMKVGLNTHMTGAGAQTSVLASATSMMGQGWDGISMGFSARNLLGVEWVTPEGEVVRVGSFDATGEYWSGDGPGFSLRGVLRGFAGTLGGLGIFTKAAVKMYPWHGPEQLDVEGVSPDYFVHLPPHHEAGMILVSSWEEFAELGYRLAEADILDYLGRSAPSLMTAGITVDNNEFAEAYAIPFMRHMAYAFMFVMCGQDADDLAWRMRSLKKVVRDLDGGLLLSGVRPSKLLWAGRAVRAVARTRGWGEVAMSLPGLLRLFTGFLRRFGAKGLDYFSAIAYEAMVRNGIQVRGVFRFGGTFHTALGALVAWDNAVLGARVGAQVKKKYIDDGILFDDGGDNAWGAIYEGGAYSHLEEVACYDPRDERCLEHANDYCIDANLATIEQKLGDCINGIGPGNHLIYGPHCWDYDRWQQRLKQALDPAGTSDASFYTDPGFEQSPPERYVRQLARVKADRAPVDLEADVQAQRRHPAANPGGGPRVLRPGELRRRLHTRDRRRR